MKRIYQIGFNKTATGSLSRFFTANNMKSVHYDGGKLSRTIQDNHAHNRPLLTGYEDVQCFSDIEHIGFGGEMVYTAEDLFREFYEQDPEAVYILNIRPVDDWVASRTKHGQGGYMLRAGYFHKTDAQGVQDVWRREYHEHIAAVKDFFKDKDNLIVFDLAEHEGDYLAAELNKRGFAVSAEHWVPSKTWHAELNYGAGQAFRALRAKLRYAGLWLGLRLRLR